MAFKSSRDCNACLACGESNLAVLGVLFPLPFFASFDTSEKRTVLTRFISFLPRLEADLARDRPALLVLFNRSQGKGCCELFGIFRPKSL